MRQGSVNAIHNSRLAFIKAAMPNNRIYKVREHEWDWACKNDEEFKEFLKKTRFWSQ